MLKDLFFNIWYDDMGFGWVLLVSLLFLLCFIFLIVYFVKIKTAKTQFNKKHLIFLSLIVIAMYQIIPVSIDFCASMIYMSDAHKSVMDNTSINKNILNNLITAEKIAIKLSIIPWQKGGYYCKIANLYLDSGEHNKMFEAYDSAYKYLKSYECPCWGISYLSFYNKKDYDTAIEIAKNTKRFIPNVFISQSYIMKGDMKNAELYIDKAIQEKKQYPVMFAIKAYILKTKGNTKESFEYYKKAKQLCKKEKEIKKVDSIYNDFIEYENQRLHKLRKSWGIEP